MMVLGLDPGLAALGYGLVRVEERRTRCVAFGVLRTRRRHGLTVGRDLVGRVGELAAAFQRLLDEHRPDEAVLEEFRFYGKAVSSCLQVANVVGMLREALRARGIPVAEYSARDIKRVVTGYPNASKAQVQRVVKLLLGLPKPPRPEHAADALAAALAYAGRLPALRLLGGAR